MRKTVILGAAPLLAVALASCSSGSSTPTNTMPETPQASMSAAANAAKVDAFCKKTKATVNKAKKWTQQAQASGGPTASMTQEQTDKISKKVKSLSTQGQNLAAEVISTPELTAKVTDCADDLQKATVGG